MPPFISGMSAELDKLETHSTMRLRIDHALRGATAGRAEAEAMGRAERIGQVPLVRGLWESCRRHPWCVVDAGTARMFLEVIELHDLDHFDVLRQGRTLSALALAAPLDVDREVSIGLLLVSL
jgi:hypothetical protein